MLKLAAWGIAALAVLICVIVVVVHLPAGRQRALAYVQQLLLQRQQIDLEIRDLRYNLLTLSFDVRNLVLRSPKAADTPPALTVERAQLDLGLWALLRGRYLVQSAQLTGVELSYVVDESGGDNLPVSTDDTQSTDDAASTEPVDYLIAQLGVSNARIRYQDRVRGIDAVVPVTALTVSGEAVTRRHDVVVESTAGQVQVAGRLIPIDTLSARLDLGRDDVRIQHALLATSGSQVTLTGSIADFTTPRADLQSHARIDLRSVGSMAAIAEPIAGHVELQSRLSGSAGELIVDSRIAGRDLAFRRFESVDLDAGAAFDQRTAQTRVDGLRVEAPWGLVTGNGVVSLEPSGESRVHVASEKLDVGAVMGAADLASRVATRLDANLDAAWSGTDYRRASGTLRAALTPTASRAARGVAPVGGRVTATARKGDVILQLERVGTDGTEVNGQIGLSASDDLSGTVRLRIHDIAKTAAVAQAMAAFAGGLPVAVSGAAVVDAKLGGGLQAPTADVAVEAHDLTVADVSGLSVSSNVSYSPQALVVHAADVRWAEAWAHAAGRVGLSGARDLDLDLSADSLDLPSVLAAAGQTDLPINGVAGLFGHVGGTIDAPIARVDVQARNLVAYGEPLGQLSMATGMTGRELSVSRLLLEKPGANGIGRLEGSARYHLDLQQYAFAIASEQLRLEQVALPDGSLLTGEVDVRGSGEGTTARPSGRIDLDVADLTRSGAAYGDLSVRAVLADQRASITASADRFRTNLEAVVVATEPYAYTLTGRVNGLDFDSLPLPPDTPLTGRTVATVRAAGDLTNARSSTVNASIDELAGTWNGRDFSVAGPATMRYEAERLAIDWLELKAEDSTLSVTGTLPLTAAAGEGAIDLDSQLNLGTLVGYVPSDTGLSGEGRIVITGRVTGTLEAVDPTLTVTVENGLLLSPLLEPGITNLSARASVADGAAVLDTLTASWGTAQLSASARLPLALLPELPLDVPRQTGPAGVKAQVTNLELATIPGVPAGLSGQVAIDASASGENVSDISSISGRVVFPQLALGFRELTLEQSQPATITLENGVATIEQLGLAGSVGEVSAQGFVELTGERAIDVSTSGQIDLGVIGTFTDEVRAEGATRFDVAARGIVTGPELTGIVEVDDARLAVQEPRIGAEDLDMRFTLAGTRVTLESLSGELNGGKLSGSGVLAYSEGEIRELDVQVSATDFAFDAPLDLRSVSDSTLRVTRRTDEIMVEGQVTIKDAGLTGNVNFDTGLLSAITARRQLDLTEQRSPILEQVRFNVNVDTATPIVVDNNLAQAEIATDLRVLGTPYETGLSGTLTLLEGGEITLNERRYQVERAVVTFLDERRIVPSFDLRLNTTASRYAITVAVTGAPGDTDSAFTSDPTLPEPDIMALLITGRTLDEMRGEEYDVAREQVLSYLTGRVGSTLGRGLERATGLSEVRIEPNLIANETDPGARLTVGQDITRELELVYSTNLADSNDQIWVAQYDVTRRFQTQVTRQSDNSYRLDFRHDVRFGGRPEPGRVDRQQRKVGSVDVPSEVDPGEAELRRLLGVKEGDTFDYFDVRRGVQRIERFYRDRGYLESRIRLNRQQENELINLTLAVSLGPLVSLTFEGAPPPDDVRADVQEQWRRGVFDAQRIDDTREVIREWLRRQRYFQPNVEVTADAAADGRRRVTVRTEPGVASERVVLVFEGVGQLDPDELASIVRQQDLEPQLFSDALVVTELLERYYREQGFLAAQIDEPRYEFESAIARVVLEVREGPRFTTTNIAVNGNRVYDSGTIGRDLPLVVGDTFLPAVAERSLERIRDLYWRQGYNDVRSDYSLVVNRDRGEVEATFTIREGRQSVVAEVTVEGTDRTSESLIRDELPLAQAQPLDLSVLGKSRKGLYDTGAFSVVDLTREEVTAADAAPTDSDANDQPDAQKPERVRVAVREVQPFQVGYGASYDTERGIGGIFDVSNHNSLGKARVVGVRSRYDRQLREIRGYVSQPSLRSWPIQTTATLYYREERNPETTFADAFNFDRRGLSIQQEKKLGNAYVWSYGYRYERVRTFGPVPGARDETLTVSPVTSTFTREQRDDVLDASRGSFTSHAFSFSPTWLGSDVTYVKYFGQYFHYFPLQPVRRKPLTNELLRPRLVYAVGVRLGLAGGFGGGSMPSAERFFAGGSSTIRGFEQNAVGPIGTDRVAQGGEALFVLNNELRVPLVSIVDGVVFADVGNTFARVRDFSFTDIRESAGVGLRLRTPWFLIRGDLGFVLDPRAGERRSRFYFSIGQAF